MQRGDDPLDVGIGCDNKMKAARDEVNAGIDRSCSFNDFVDAGMGTADHDDQSFGGIDDQGKFAFYTESAIASVIHAVTLAESQMTVATRTSDPSNLAVILRQSECRGSTIATSRTRDLDCFRTWGQLAGFHRSEGRLGFCMRFDLARAVPAFDANTSDSS